MGYFLDRSIKIYVVVVHIGDSKKCHNIYMYSKLSLVKNNFHLLSEECLFTIR